MFQRIWNYVQEMDLIRERDYVIAGVSGGADSVCLLLILIKLCKNKNAALTVLHVEHGIRGEESRADADFVQQLCKTLMVPCRTVPVDVPAYARERHFGHEEAARILGYEAFQAAAAEARQMGYAPEQIRIALAHHREDLAETVLFQLVRGSGISGLCGIRPVREDPSGFFYIRPMLTVSRQEIEEYLAQAGQDYRTDPSNFDTGYSRNRIRHEIFPQLCRINDRAAVHIQRTAEQMGRIEDYLMQQAQAQAERIIRKEGHRTLLDIPMLLGIHPALQEAVLRHALFQTAGQRKDISAVHVDMLQELTRLQSGRSAHLPYGIRAVREYDSLILEKGDQSALGSEGDAAPVTVDGGQLQGLLESRQSLSILLSRSEILTLRVLDISGKIDKIPKKTYTKWLDYDMIKNGFIVRNRMPGDYFCMDGEGHHKKLKQYFTEEKIPAGLRGKMWLLAQESKVLWLIGGRISEDGKVTGNTKRVIELVYEGGN